MNEFVSLILAAFGIFEFLGCLGGCFYLVAFLRGSVAKRKFRASEEVLLKRCED